MHWFSAAVVSLCIAGWAVLVPLDARGNGAAAAQEPARPCDARAPADGTVAVQWHAGQADDGTTLDQWCRGVGRPVLIVSPAEAPAPAPSLDDLVVLTWNAHLGDGRLDELVTRLRAGAFTDGRPVRHFVLLVQELYRRGSDVPEWAETARAAYAITSREADSPDAHAYSRTLGASVFYVPSMRNGAETREDRGNAIVSSEPLHDLFAVELPYERQRRVAVGAQIVVSTPRGPLPLTVVNVHLDPLSSPSALWVFRNPRRRQLHAVLSLLREENEPTAGVVLGGDFNTVQGGDAEGVYLDARSWSSGTSHEDSRRTHRMGRLDYLFFRLSEGWHTSTTRLDDTFGSDHFPVLGRFMAATTASASTAQR